MPFTFNAFNVVMGMLELLILPFYCFLYIMFPFSLFLLSLLPVGYLNIFRILLIYSVFEDIFYADFSGMLIHTHTLG